MALNIALVFITEYHSGIGWALLNALGIWGVMLVGEMAYIESIKE
jgi:hypothetical protein